MKLWILIFLSVGLMSHESWAINYFRCETDKDCVKAYGGCGRYLALHRRYKELYEAKAHKADRVASCLAPTEKDKVRKHQGLVSCEKSSCRLKLPPIVEEETVK